MEQASAPHITLKKPLSASSVTARRSRNSMMASASTKSLACCC